MSPASFGKRQREKERREKAQAKAAKRAERASAPADDAPPPPPVDEGALLAELALVHERFENGEIDFETFTDAKQDITAKLLVD